MKQVPQWKPTNIRAHCTKFSLSGRPGAQDLYTPFVAHTNSETKAFLGQDPVRCKIAVDNKCLEQVKNFKIWVMEGEKTINKT